MEMNPTPLIPQGLLEQARAWMARDPDAQTREELAGLLEAGDGAELRGRFGGRLEFGTAGLRGVVGAGPMRMNRLVIRETSAGLGRYLLGLDPAHAAAGVVVGFDGRLHSRVFAQDCASVLAGLGFRVWLAEEPVPTPVCAYAVRHLGAAAGVVVTASHNPPEYNGFKVYGSNGAQIIPPHDAGVAQAIEEAARAPLPWREAPEVEPLIAAVGEAYLVGLCAQVGAVEGEAARALGVAYTPMHGVGCKWVEEALRRLGFAPPHVVAEQREPDGHFPTVRFPNPEEPGAMDLLLALARASGADVALANDPDADRLAVAAPDAQGAWRALTGNQIGALLGDHALAQAEGSAEPLCVGTTIVSSQLLGHIARAHGAVCYETLTGFKWIANEAMRREEAEGARFVFGYEEALGYTVGRLVRDKDGVSAAAAFARLAAELKAQGQTVYGRLEALYRAHGLFVTGQVTIPWRPGSPGPHERLRAHPPTHIAGRAVVSRDDLSVRARFDAQGARSEVALPASDVLIYRLDDGARVIVRPSGTEPKLKCYYELQARVAPDEPFVQAEARAQAALQALMADHQREMFA